MSRSNGSHRIQAGKLDSETESPQLKVSIRDLRVSYSKHVALDLKNIEFSGNTFALIGHNGAGKSTFIKTALGLLVPSTGSIGLRYFDGGGDDVDMIPKEHMAFCPESGAVFSDISVESYIKLWCRFKKNDGKFYLKEGAKYVEILELEPLMGRLGRELSKGQRRRVLTAIGFLVEPKCFLIDEPFDGLDVQRTHELAQIIREHSRRMTFIVSSHRMDVMERIADYALVLKEGEFVANGPVEAVSRQLSGGTFLIELMYRDGQPLVPFGQIEAILLAELPTVVLNRFSGGLAITGHDLSQDLIQSTLAKAELNGSLAAIREASPSLVDAMTYHLKIK